MPDSFIAQQYSKHCKCEVCGCQIRYADFLLLKKQGYLVCHSFDCKNNHGPKGNDGSNVI